MDIVTLVLVATFSIVVLAIVSSFISFLMGRFFIDKTDEVWERYFEKMTKETLECISKMKSEHLRTHFNENFS